MGFEILSRVADFVEKNTDVMKLRAELLRENARAAAWKALASDDGALSFVNDISDSSPLSEHSALIYENVMPPSCRDSYLKPFCKAGEFLKAVVHPASKKSHASVLTNLRDATRRLGLEAIKFTDSDPVYPRHWENLEGQIGPFYRKGPSYNIDRGRSFLQRMPLMEMSLKYMRYELPADHASKVAAQYGKSLATAALSAAMVFLLTR